MNAQQENQYVSYRIFNLLIASTPFKNVGFAAMKLEERSRDDWNEILRMEVYVLQEVKQIDKRRYFCTLHDYGRVKDYKWVDRI